mgnify:CR=1 FL=1
MGGVLFVRQDTFIFINSESNFMPARVCDIVMRRLFSGDDRNGFQRPRSLPQKCRKLCPHYKNA